MFRIFYILGEFTGILAGIAVVGSLQVLTGLNIVEHRPARGVILAAVRSGCRFLFSRLFRRNTVPVAPADLVDGGEPTFPHPTTLCQKVALEAHYCCKQLWDAAIELSTQTHIPAENWFYILIKDENHGIRIINNIAQRNSVDPAALANHMHGFGFNFESAGRLFMQNYELEPFFRDFIFLCFDTFDDAIMQQINLYDQLHQSASILPDDILPFE